MKALPSGLPNLPGWTVPWVIVLGVIAWIVGAHKLAKAAFILLVYDLLIGPILALWVNQLPAWALPLVNGVLALLILQGLVALLFGNETAAHVTGSYLVRLLDTVLLGPVRILARLILGRWLW